MKISVVGTGYVGLVTGTCFAETGIHVTCVDIDERKIQMLKNGKVPIYEPGLDEMIIRNEKKGRLFFTTSLKDSLVDAEAIFISVGTPPDEDGSADLKHVLNVAHEVGKYMQQYMVVVTKSTVPVGTAEKVRAAIKEELEKRKANIPFDIASNPEFLKEGSAIDDFLKPDRIVIGIESERAEKVMRKLYKPFLLNNHPIIFMDIPSAELTKYAANAMLATKISFMNDIANLCEIVSADINSVRKGIGSDPRIGEKFIYAGVGYGGSCFPKDVKALIKTANDNTYNLRILKAVEEVNDDQKKVVYKKIAVHFNNQLQDKVIALWGLSFKPQTDDMREAPALTIIDDLYKAGAKITVYDPVAMEECEKKIGNMVQYAKGPYEAVQNADVLVLVTEWPEFRVPDYTQLKERMKGNVIVDGRNIYDPTDVREQGFVYYGIGRK